MHESQIYSCINSASKRLSKHKFMWNQKADFDLEHQFVNTQHYLKQVTYNEQFGIHGFQNVTPYKLLTQIHGQQGNNKQDNTSSSPLYVSPI